MDRKILAQRICCFFLVYVLLSMQFSLVFSADAVLPAAPTGAGALPTATAGAIVPTVSRDSFSCNQERLSEIERQNLWDSLLKNGFVGRELNSGTAPNKERDSLVEGSDKKTVVTPDAKGEFGLKQELPALKIKPEEINHLLRNYSNGAFSFGLEITDSFRAGRCKDSTKGCPLVGDKLSLRSSGSGIVTDVKNVFKDLKEVFGLTGDDEKLDTKQTGNISLDSIKAEIIQAENSDQKIEAKIARRKADKMMPNSILTDSFTASMNSNCTTSECIISSYSMFDKIYNSYFSTEMLFTTFGPTLVGKTRAMYNWTAVRYAPEPGEYLGIKILGKNIPLSLKETKFYRRLKGSLFQPGSFLTLRKGTRMQQIVDKYGLQFDHVLKDKYLLAQGGTFNAYVPDIIQAMLKEGGDDVVKRRAIWQYLKEWRDYSEAISWSREVAEQEFKAATAGLAVTDPAYLFAKRKYAGKMGMLWDYVDDSTGLDIPEWFANHKSIKWNKYAVKTQTGDFVQPAVDSHYMDRILRKLNKDGDFAYTADDMEKLGTIFDNSGGKLALYEVTPTGKKVTDVALPDLDSVISKGHIQDSFAQLADGSFVPLNKENMAFITAHAPGGSVPIYRGSWQKSRELSADELSDMILGPRGKGRVDAMRKNSTRLLQSATENNFYTSEKAASLLEKAMRNEKNIVKTYLNPKGAVKWTTYPFAYWGAKRGFGNEDASAFMLPDTWKTVIVSPGEQQIYNDAFIDFFSNEGSDQGDVFSQFLNNMPWKMVYDTGANLYKPLRDVLDKLTRNELRNTVGNLAVYTAGSSDCRSCGLTLDAEGTDNFSPFFNAPETLNTFILEDTPADQKKIGQTLIAYTRHTNLKGKTSELKSEDGINLTNAMKEKNTCSDKVSELTLGGIPIGKLMNKIGVTGAEAGGVLALGETITYATFFWAGILGSAMQQFIIAPQLQDCVDVDEGYFVHFFAPAKPVRGTEEAKKQTPATLSTEKLNDLVEKGKDRVSEMFEGNSNTLTSNALDDAKDSIEKLVNNAEENDIVEALLKTNSFNTGQFKGTDLFYLWIQGGADLTPSDYKTEGKSVIEDEQTKTKVEVDYKNGIVYVNGKPIITNPDISRLYSINTAIPAGEFPNAITKLGLPTNNPTGTMFEMTVKGNLFVRSQGILDCIKAGVMEQTGVGLSTNDLTEVFGNINSIITDTHPNIYPDSANNRVVAEGRPRQIAQGTGALAIVQENLATSIWETSASGQTVGKLKSIQFKNGVIIVKPETNELIVWLKRNEKAILSQDDVSGLSSKLTTVKNPITNCDEPAIALAARAIPESELAKERVNLFNQSMEKMGPYNIFETPTKRFIFYSKLENGECKDYFKIIDKETGKVLVDQPIDSIEQTPDGVRVKTADGKTHDLSFGAENGQPFLTYNGVQEPLRIAQGPNGAFWYDPEKGQWYAENAQLLPLLEAFKNKGILTQANPVTGAVSTVPGGNPLNINIGQGSDSALNLPSLPSNLLLLIAYLCSLMTAIIVIRKKIKTKNC